MKRIVDIAAIEARKKEIGEQLDRLDNEMHELNLALRVLLKYGLSDSVVPDASSQVTQIDSGNKLGPPRPEGIPNNYEMAFEVLEAAVKAGKKGLTAAELVDEIGRRWWPGLQGPQILPIMYTYAKKGRLVKGDDGYFSLPPPQKEEVPTAATEGTSDPEEDGDRNSVLFE